MTQRRFLLILVVASALGCAKEAQDFAQARAAINCQSVADHPEGSWVKIRNDKGEDLTITVTKKELVNGVWNTVTTISSAKGSVEIKSACDAPSDKGGAELASVQNDTLEIAGKRITCKLFTHANGQKTWLSTEVPAGGYVKIVGPNKEAFFTLLAYGATPPSQG